MKLLMLLRDSLPPRRVDVDVLFDQQLRSLGIDTDFAGPGTPAHTNGTGRLFTTGATHGARSGWRQAALAWRLARGYRLVVVRDLPIVALAVRWACRRHARPFIYWMSFPMPLGDRLGAAQHWHAGRRLRATVAWLRGTLAQQVQDRWVLPQAAHVFVQSETMRQALLTALPALRAERVTAVPMGVDDRSLPPLHASGAAQRTQAETIVYLGSLDRVRRLDVLIDALALVRLQRPGARLWLIGAAPRNEDLAWLQRHAHAQQLDAAVDFTGALPMAQAWQRVQQACVAVSAVPPGPLHDVSSPTKIVEYLALGLPVVANDIPEQRALLAACGGGRCVRFDARAFADAILELLADLPAARAAATQARGTLLQQRSYRVLGDGVARVLHGLAA